MVPVCHEMHQIAHRDPNEPTARLAGPMAGPLTAVERFFERLFERPAARLFQARLEPVQIQRSLERAMESERRIHARRTYAPAFYRVQVNPLDDQALEAAGKSLLLSDLSEGLRQYARSHGYTLLARPQVQIDAVADVPQGDVRVAAAAPDLPEPTDGGQNDSQPVFAQPAPIEGDGDSHNVDISQATAIFAAPAPTIPRAVMAIRAPGQNVSRMDVRPGTIRLGRSLDNDIVLSDERVSRHHGQITARLGMLVYTDLGSTNGSFLNNSPVTEIALGPGDVLQLGSSTITIEPGS